MSTFERKVASALLCMAGASLTLQVISMAHLIDADRRLDAIEHTITAITDVRPVPSETPTETTSVIPTVPVTTPTPTPEPVRHVDCPLDDATQAMIASKCDAYNIDFYFLMALIYQESRYQVDAVSPDGRNIGLMQINKINHPRLREALGITDFHDPAQNVEAGLYMLRELFEQYEDPGLVLMAYNMGEAGASRLWEQGIYTSEYATAILNMADQFQ